MKKQMSLDENQKTLLLITEERSLDIQTYITKFKKIIAGPFYICCVCNDLTKREVSSPRLFCY